MGVGDGACIAVTPKRTDTPTDPLLFVSWTMFFAVGAYTDSAPTVGCLSVLVGVVSVRAPTRVFIVTHGVFFTLVGVSVHFGSKDWWSTVTPKSGGWGSRRCRPA